MRNTYKMRKNELKDWDMMATPEDWEIVNTNEDGRFDKHYGFKVWPLAGYFVDLFSVYGDNEEDAINILLDYLKENNYPNCFTDDKIYNDYVSELGFEAKRNPEEYGLTKEQVEDLSEEDVFDLLDEDIKGDFFSNFLGSYVQNDDGNIFVFSDNFEILDWPKDYPAPETVKKEGKSMRKTSHRKFEEYHGSRDIAEDLDEICWKESERELETERDVRRALYRIERAAGDMGVTFGLVADGRIYTVDELISRVAHNLDEGCYFEVMWVDGEDGEHYVLVLRDWDDPDVLEEIAYFLFED